VRDGFNKQQGAVMRGRSWPGVLGVAVVLLVLWWLVR